MPPKPHIYCVNEGSRYAPLERGPVRFHDEPIDLSTATVQVRVVKKETQKSVLDWEDADAEGEGDANGVLHWVIPETLVSGAYLLWWRFDLAGEEPCVIGPDEIHVNFVP